MSYPFNVRVYGLLMNSNNEVLVADELIYGRKITKFPGGGLEFGEGTIDAIKREMMEETGITVDVINHFYTTDFFQASAFNAKVQVLSIYYTLKALTPVNIRVTHTPYDFENEVEGAISFRWISLKTITEDQFTFPIDKKVANMLKGLKIV